MDKKKNQSAKKSTRGKRASSVAPKKTSTKRQRTKSYAGGSKNEARPLRERNVDVEMEEPAEEDEEYWPSSHHFTQLMREELPGVSQAEIQEVRSFVLDKFDEIHAAYRQETTAKAETDFLSSLASMTLKYAVVDYEQPNLDKSESFEIDTCEKQPRAKQWIHSDKSYIKPDNHRLSHLPYIEKYNTSEKELTEKCWNNFKEGIHGADAGCGKHISHFEAYQLFKSFEENENFQEENDPLIKKKLRIAFFTLFPNTFTYEELKEPLFLTHLEMRFNPDYELPEPETFNEEILHWNNNLCTKCSLLDCPFHINRQKQDRPYINPVSFTFAAEPCSPRCGRNLLQDADNYMDISKFESKYLEDIFKTLFHGKLDICSITSQMNTLCILAGHKTFSCREYTRLARIEKQVPIQSKPQLRRDRYKLYLRYQVKFNINPSKVAPPCQHPGPCEKAGSACTCVANNAPCTAECKCGISCKLLFPGCHCPPGSCNTLHCICFKGNWECNPLTCDNCHSNIYTLNDDHSQPVCSNIPLQNGWKKSVKVAVSTIPNAGYGLFVQQAVFKDELISEYVGELISDDEAERRGIVYDEMFLSYHFKLGENEDVLDAYKIGNLMRFANHKFADQKPNCKPKVVRVNGARHIGIYADRNIEVGEELFFDYGYTPEHFERFKSGNEKSSRD